MLYLMSVNTEPSISANLPHSADKPFPFIRNSSQATDRQGG